jgi:Pro-kumamolisin, activation domain
MKSVRFLNALQAIAAVAILLCSVNVAGAQQAALMSVHVPDAVRSGQAAAVGAVDSGSRLQLAISLPLRNEAALDTLLQQIYDPQSPNFHHYLSVQEFTGQFAPTQQDYDAVVAWAQSKGLQVTGTTPNRRLISVEGSVATINSAFNIQLNTYQDNVHSRTFHAPDREPTVDLSIPLLAISGLDDVHPPHPHYRKGDRPSPVESNTTEAGGAIAHIVGSGPGNTYLPSDMRAAYYGNGPLTGAGQTVAIFSFDGYIATDLSLYYSSTHTTSNVPVSNVLVGGYSGACFGFNTNGTENPNTCDDGEQILDIVNVIGMAPGLTQVLFYEGDSATQVLNQMASDNIATVISSSWGGGDFGLASDSIFKEFQAQGQSYLNATGDDGEFNTSTYDPPSVDANITQVGGTDLTTTGAGGPWASETGWADSGGGFITGTAIPSYQQLPGVITATNKGSTTLRNAPDVAAEANFDNTTVISGKFEAGYGGTSFATPRWAGLIALANQQSVANGNGTLGFLNPSIYNIGLGSSYAADFHDIVSGLNKPLAGTGTGFNAVAGYDLVTGWGSPNGPALIATLAGSPAPSSDYSLSSSPSSVSVVAGASGSTTITITPISGFSSAVSLTASGLPAGVTASFSPASATTSSRLTLTAASTATVGVATVTITGISGSLTHTTTVALTITPAPDYSLSSSPSSVSVVAGTSGSSTITITPINSFSGSVALSASGLPTGVTASFSPASATTSSVLTLTAASTATAGTATVTITGTSGTLTHTTTVALTITPAPDYSLSSTPSSVSIVAGTSGSSTIAVSALNGFAGAVSLTASGLPAGVTASFSPASATTSSTLTLTVANTATAGLSTITITGTSGTLTHTTTVALTITPAPDYSLSSTPSSVSVVAGASGSSTVTVTGLHGFTGSVALSASGLPAGITASFSPASTTGSSTLTLTAASTATVGPATVTITGISGTLTHTTTVALTITPPPDYSLSASPVSVIQGNSGTSAIAVAALNGFSGLVNLTASGLPAGVTASFSPASTSSTSILTLTAASTAAAGVSNITITGTSGSLTHTATVALTVLMPDYSLSASPVSVVQGGSASSTIAVADLNGFSGAVSLTATGMPLGVTASFSSKTTTGVSTLTLTTMNYTPAGPATITITGVSGGLTHTATAVLTVAPPPDYSFSLSPNHISVLQGASANATVAVTPINGFNAAVNLSFSGLPAGVTASFTPASPASPGSVTFTAASTASGSGTVTVTGTSGSLSHPIYISLSVTPTPNYSLSASPANPTVVQGTSGTSTILVTDISGFTGSVALTVSGLPNGVTASLNAPSTAKSSILTLTASSTAAVGPATVTITGTSGSLTQTATVNLTVASAADYSLTASPVSITQGASGSSTVAVTQLNGFTGSVNLAASGLPAGVTASFSPASATTSSMLTLTAASTATVGAATVTITGTSGTLTHTATVALTVTPAPDYALSSTPGSVSVVAGTSGSSTIAITGINSFSSSVNLAASGLPAGVTASFSPASATTSSILTLTVANTATAGAATVTITGTSGSLTHTTTVSLTVLAPDYSLSATPGNLTIPYVGSASSTIAVTDLSGFSGAVSLKVSGLPAGVTASFSPATTTGTSTLTFTAANWAVKGTATVTVTGTSGALIHTTTVALTVAPEPDFSLSLSAPSVAVPQGGSQSSTVTVNGLNGFNSPVALSVSGLPAGVTASFIPASPTSPGTLTLTAAPTAAAGSGTITITGTSGGLSHQIYVSAVVALITPQKK